MWRKFHMRYVRKTESTNTTSRVDSCCLSVGGKNGIIVKYAKSSVARFILEIVSDHLLDRFIESQ